MNTFEFHNPHFLWLLFVVPIIAYLSRKFYKPATLKFSNIEIIKNSTPRSRRSNKILLFLRHLAIIFIIFALARPQKISHSSEVNSSGIDIMLAIDISSSMMGLDFLEKNEQNLVTRLDIAKKLTKEFIRGRAGDRMGMCAFAGSPYLVSPVTLNHDWLVENLSRLHVNLVEDGTAIGDTIAMCVNRLKNSQSKSKVIVLLTDGGNTFGSVAPLVATEAACALHVKIYTIGIGKEGIVNFAYPDKNGDIICDPFENPIITQAIASIDEGLLQAIAEKTNGKFFKAENKKEFLEIFRMIDELEKSDIKIKQFAQAEDFFPWIIGIALILLLLECLLRNLKLQRIP